MFYVLRVSRYDPYTEKYRKIIVHIDAIGTELRRLLRHFGHERAIEFDVELQRYVDRFKYDIYALEAFISKYPTTRFEHEVIVENNIPRKLEC